MKTCVSWFLSLVLVLLAVADSRGQAEAPTTLPLVVSGAVFGDDLLHRIHIAAEAAGYEASPCVIGSQMRSEPGIILEVPALLIVSPSEPKGPIKLTSQKGMTSEQRLLVSFHVITKKSKSDSAVGEVTMRLFRKRDHSQLVETTVKVGRGWTSASLAWTADETTAAGELELEITIASRTGFKLTLPQALILPGNIAPTK